MGFMFVCSASTRHKSETYSDILVVTAHPAPGLQTCLPSRLSGVTPTGAVHQRPTFSSRACRGRRRSRQGRRRRRDGQVKCVALGARDRAKPPNRTQPIDRGRLPLAVMPPGQPPSLPLRCPAQHLWRARLTRSPCARGDTAGSHHPAFSSGLGARRDRSCIRARLVLATPRVLGGPSAVALRSADIPDAAACTMLLLLMPHLGQYSYSPCLFFFFSAESVVPKHRCALSPDARIDEDGPVVFLPAWLGQRRGRPNLTGAYRHGSSVLPRLSVACLGQRSGRPVRERVHVYSTELETFLPVAAVSLVDA
jgi:hypothetical protein